MRETTIFHHNPLTEPPSRQFTVILANPPFNGAVDKARIATSLRGGKTELLFTDLILQALKLGGRAAVIVPAGLLFGRTKAHRALRRELIDEHCLSAIFTLPKGVFKRKPPRWIKGRGQIGPDSGAHILRFTRGAETGLVRFCELAELTPAALTAILPGQSHGQEAAPGCTCWTATREAIVANGYDLSPNRYRSWEEPEPPQPVNAVWGELKQLEAQIARSSAELETMLYGLGFEPELPEQAELDHTKHALQTHLGDLRRTFSEKQEGPDDQP